MDSPHSKRAYSRALIDFLDWYARNGRPGFTKAIVNACREHLLQEEKSRSSISQALSADNGLVSPTLAYGVERVKGVKQEGGRAGNWLTKEEAEKLVNTPVALWRQKEIPLLKAIRALNKDGSLAGSVKTKEGGHTDGNVTPQAIYNVVKEHVLAAGLYNAGLYKRKGEAALAAHDLRRTVAVLALKDGADLRQIQQMLGHASITTTERYLEPMRSLQVMAGDFIQIELALATD
ncbi:MAG: tyrosine-type recombinase/integrase [Anaerolineae bacterium]|nr:tyrosine-type recombinase/integrase [Anaerolineae bacterium]